MKKNTQSNIFNAVVRIDSMCSTPNFNTPWQSKELVQWLTIFSCPFGHFVVQKEFPRYPFSRQIAFTLSAETSFPRYQQGVYHAACRDQHQKKDLPDLPLLPDQPQIAYPQCRHQNHRIRRDIRHLHTTEKTLRTQQKLRNYTPIRMRI